MKHAGTTALDHLEAAARAAHGEENAYRTEAARRIGEMEAARVAAYRRVRLVRVLTDAAASSIAGDGEAPPVAAVQRGAVATDLGWDVESDHRSAVLDALADVGRAVVEGGDVVGELARFESWYQARVGEPFWRLFDVYVPEAPVVDF